MTPKVIFFPSQLRGMGQKYCDYHNGVCRFDWTCDWTTCKISVWYVCMCVLMLAPPGISSALFCHLSCLPAFSLFRSTYKCSAGWDTLTSYGQCWTEPTPEIWDQNCAKMTSCFSFPEVRSQLGDPRSSFPQELLPVSQKLGLFSWSSLSSSSNLVNTTLEPQ